MTTFRARPRGLTCSPRMHLSHQVAVHDRICHLRMVPVCNSSLGHHLFEGVLHHFDIEDFKLVRDSARRGPA